MLNAGKIICLALFVFTTTTSLAQERQIIMPINYDDKLEGKEIQKDQSFIILPFEGSTVNLVKVVEQYPESDIPMVMNIIPPDLTGYTDANIMAMMIKTTMDQPSNLFLMVSARKEGTLNQATFFVDELLDYNFLNDREPVVVVGGEKPKKVIISPPLGKDEKIFLSMANELMDEETQDLISKNGKKKIVNQLAVGVHLGFGNTKLDYSYDNLETGFPTWYSVNSTEKNIGLTLSYNLRPVIIEFASGYHNHFYYTSNLNIKTAPDRYETEPGSTRQRLVESINVLKNLDEHDRNHLQLSVRALFRIKLGRTVEVQPLVGAGKIIYLSNQYIGDIRGEQEIYTLDPTNFLEGGLRLEFAVGRFRSFYMSGKVNQVFWEPTGFFESVEHKNRELSFTGWNATFGYRMAIFN